MFAGLRFDEHGAILGAQGVQTEQWRARIAATVTAFAADVLHDAKVVGELRGCRSICVIQERFEARDACGGLVTFTCVRIAEIVKTAPGMGIEQ